MKPILIWAWEKHGIANIKKIASERHDFKNMDA
jgi:hypothetical protein